MTTTVFQSYSPNFAATEERCGVHHKSRPPNDVKPGSGLRLRRGSWPSYPVYNSICENYLPRVFSEERETNLLSILSGNGEMGRKELEGVVGGKVC
jgi:hypothetical protein